MVYELAFFMLSVSAYLIFQNRVKNKRKSKIASIFLFLIIIAYLFVYLTFSQKTLGHYTGTTISLNFINIFLACIIEAFGSFPLSYGAYLASSKLNFSTWLVWGGYTFFLVMLFVLVTSPQNTLKQLFIKHKNAIIYGILIWFSAAVSISFSSRYQDELTPGLSYAVVYMQNFGFAILVFPFINLKYFIPRLSIIVVVILTFIMNSLIIYEDIKVDGAKLVMFKTISNKEIVDKYKFDYTIFNEKIFQSDDIYNKHYRMNFGNPLFLKMVDISKGNLPFDANIGMVLASVDVYKKSYSIIGRFNRLSFCLEDGALMTLSFSRSQELAKLFASGPIITYRLNGEVLYGFHIKGPILIPDKLVGSFR